MNITKSMLSEQGTPCEDGLAWFIAQKDHSFVALVKEGIKGGKDTIRYVNWGLRAIMTKEQRIEYAIYAAYHVAYLWKEKYPKEYAVWSKWASGEDRGAAAWAAAGDAAWDADGDAAWDAAYNKMLAKIIRNGVRILSEKGKA